MAKEGGVNAAHRGDPALDTANWRDVDGPGNLRISYILPSADWAVVDSGLIWPEPSGSDGSPVTRHGLVWVDLRG